MLRKLKDKLKISDENAFCPQIIQFGGKIIQISTSPHTLVTWRLHLPDLAFYLSGTMAHALMSDPDVYGKNVSEWI